MDSGRLICQSIQLVERGPGVRFEVDDGGEKLPAFAVRYDGEVRAYINRCAHLGLTLDLMPGRFFDRRGEHLICATHGAMYDPGSGACAGGPCQGAGLEPLRISENQGRIELLDRIVVSPARRPSTKS